MPKFTDIGKTLSQMLAPEGDFVVRISIEGGAILALAQKPTFLNIGYYIPDNFRIEASRVAQISEEAGFAPDGPSFPCRMNSQAAHYFFASTTLARQEAVNAIVVILERLGSLETARCEVVQPAHLEEWTIRL